MFNIPEQPTSRWIATALCLFACIIGAARLHNVREPLERDLTTYAVVADGVLNGRALYADLWDHKPPGIYLANMLAQAIVGYGPWSVFALGYFNAVVTMIGVYTAARSTGRGSMVGLSAAAFWVTISGDLYLQANQPNVEVFLNSCFIWLFAVLLARPGPRLGMRAAVLCGLLLGLAVLFKPTALTIVLLFAAHVLRPVDGQARLSRSVLLPACAALLVAGTVISSVGLYFAVIGHVKDFWNAVVVYNRYYGGDLWRNMITMLHPQMLLHPALRDAVPLLAATALLPVLSQHNAAPSRAGLLTVTYGLGVLVAIGLPGRFFPHYYQLWLPLLCVASAWGIDELARALRNGRTHVWRLRAFAMVVAVVIYLQFPAFGLTPQQWSQRKYGDVFVHSQFVGQWLERVLLPQESFYNWGKETGLYFTSRRQPPSGVFFSYPLLHGPLKDSLAERLLSDLQRDPPQLFLVSDEFPHDHPVHGWFSIRYAALPETAQVPGFDVYFLKDGEFAARRKIQARLGH